MATTPKLAQATQHILQTLLPLATYSVSSLHEARAPTSAHINTLLQWLIFSAWICQYTVARSVGPQSAGVVAVAGVSVVVSRDAADAVVSHQVAVGADCPLRH
jgi:hypothetical protein